MATAVSKAMPSDAPLLPSWAKEEPAPNAPRITTRPATVVAIDGLCRAWIARTTSMMAAMTSRMPRITWIASSGLENMPTDLLLVGAVPYRLEAVPSTNWMISIVRAPKLAMRMRLAAFGGSATGVSTVGIDMSYTV